MLHTGQALEPRQSGWKLREPGTHPTMGLRSQDLHRDHAGEGILWGAALGVVIWAAIVLMVLALR